MEIYIICTLEITYEQEAVIGFSDEHHILDDLMQYFEEEEFDFSKLED